MKNKAVKIIDYIKYEHLEFLSYISLILWVVSPLVEFILKKYVSSFYSNYFSLSIYIIGVLGFIIYDVYIIKMIKDKKLKIKNCIPHIFIAILWIISVISTILSNNPTLSLLGEGYRREGLIVYTFYIAFVLSSSIINNKKNIHNLFKIIIISALVITIVPLFNKNFTFHIFANVYHNTNHYGYFLMISTILAGFEFMQINGWKDWKKYFYLFSYILLLFMLIKNDTFGCYLALIISLVLLLIYLIIKKYKVIEAASLVLIFILLSFTDSKLNIGSNPAENNDIVINNISSFKNDIKIILSGDKEALKRVGSSRGLLWMGAINYSLENPIFGGGFESLKEYYIKEDMLINDRPHNILLQISSFIGIPAAIIYLVLIVYLAIINLKYLKKDAINIAIYFTSMCYFISSQFGNSMYYTSPYFMILVGLLIGIYNSEKVS